MTLSASYVTTITKTTEITCEENDTDILHRVTDRDILKSRLTNRTIYHQSPYRSQPNPSEAKSSFSSPSSSLCLQALKFLRMLLFLSDHSLSLRQSPVSKNQINLKSHNRTSAQTFPFVLFLAASSCASISASFSIILKSVLHLLCNS